jgi:hypothetical protein
MTVAERRQTLPQALVVTGTKVTAGITLWTPLRIIVQRWKTRMRVMFAMVTWQ